MRCKFVLCLLSMYHHEAVVLGTVSWLHSSTMHSPLSFCQACAVNLIVLGLHGLAHGFAWTGTWSCIMHPVMPCKVGQDFGQGPEHCV